MINNWNLVISSTIFFIFTLNFSTACAQEKVYLQQAADVAPTATVKQASEIARPPLPIRRASVPVVPQNVPPPPPARSEDVRILEFDVTDADGRIRLPRARIVVQ